ncbi:MAG TPA: hypothetical protein VI318_06550 [Baekduia sp.]
MQIALVAVVLLAGMWFTVLKPKPADDSSAPAAAVPAQHAASSSSSSQPVAPGVKGLTSAIDKAKAASATSDATNAKIQAATGGGGTTPTATPATAKSSNASSTATPAAKKHAAVKSATKAKAKAPVAAVKPGTKAATAKALTAKPATVPAVKSAVKPAAAASVDPSDRLLAYLAKGKTLVVLFYGNGADDKAARKAVHRTALADPKHVVSAYVPIADVGKYEAITSDVSILSAPTILVIGTDGKATPLTGYVDATVVEQTVGDARRNAAAAAKSTK